MAKAMTIAGMLIAGVLGAVFALDLVLGMPFGGRSKMTDAVFVLCAGVLGYLAWNAYRDSK